MMTDRTARSTTTASTAGAMVAATHALHVHTVAVVLSYYRRAYGRVGHPTWASPGSSLGQPRSIDVDGDTRRARRYEPSRLGAQPCRTPATWLPYTRPLALPNNFFAI
jgi:hypothetical protein